MLADGVKVCNCNLRERKAVFEYQTGERCLFAALLTAFLVAVILCISNVRSDWITKPVAQTVVAHGARLVEKIQEFGYERRHRERLDHLRHELPKSEVVKMKTRSRQWRVRGRKRHVISKGELDRERKVVQLEIE